MSERNQENILCVLFLALAANMLCMAATLPQQLERFNRFMGWLTH